MYKKHPTCHLPSSEEAIIWRFMDLSKLLSIFEKEALFFSRISKLYPYDPFEGFYPKITFDKTIEGKEQAIKEIRDQMNQDGPSEWVEKYISDIRNAPSYNRTFREMICVSCWHLSDFDSPAMWNSYAPRGYGVAIRSTFNRLCNSFKKTPIDVQIGTITYLDDYEKDEISMRNMMYPFLHKRKSFEYEHELRALALDLVNIPPDLIPDNYKGIQDNNKGIYIPVVVQDLVETVYLAPQTEPWFEDAVRDVLKKYDINVNVIKSGLLNSPYWVRNPSD